MRVIRKYFAIILALALAFGAVILTGCDDQNKDEKTEKTSTATDKASKEVNANWTIGVNDKHTVDTKGLPVEYTLQFTATKAGGTDPTGTYKGTAHLSIKADFSKVAGIPQNVVKVSGGVSGEGDAKDLSFKVITFADAQKGAKNNSNTDPSETLATLVPPGKTKTTGTLPAPTAEDKAVANPDYYSYSSMVMKGMGNLNIQAQGIGGEHGQYADQKSASDSVSFSMNIVGATVYIDIPNAGRFKGTVTGDPIK